MEVSGEKQQPITSFAVCVNKNFVTTNYVTTPWTNQQFGSAECNPSNPNQEVTGGGFGFESGSTGGSYPATVQAWKRRLTMNPRMCLERLTQSARISHTTSIRKYMCLRRIILLRALTYHQVIGGGYVTNLGDPNLIVTLSRPTNDNSGWHVALTGDSNVKASAFAVCAIIPANLK